MKYLFALVLVLSSFNRSYSCSCWGPMEFCELVADTFHNRGHIIMGKKLSNVEHGMDIEVIKSYYNMNSEVIRVWGDLGWLCREYVGGFEVGDTFVFNLSRIGSDRASSLEKSQDFQLSFCGRHFLKVSDGMVVGRFSGNRTQRISIDRFDRYMESGDCALLTSIEEVIDAKIGPNPFYQNIQITSEQPMSEILLYDITGKLILKDNVSGNSHNLELGYLNLSPGCYVIRIIANRLEDRVIKVIKA